MAYPFLGSRAEAGSHLQRLEEGGEGKGWMWRRIQPPATPGALPPRELLGHTCSPRGTLRGHTDARAGCWDICALEYPFKRKRQDFLPCLPVVSMGLWKSISLHSACHLSP